MDNPNLKPQQFYYEYIRLVVSSDLKQLNRYSELGWKVICLIDGEDGERYYLLERRFEKIWNG